ncbi:MAG: hypothetical protein HY293_00180, partial [Planctomycetes bacterium]|nr:hypothetical protein [Planctomycetota bacterium]
AGADAILIHDAVSGDFLSFEIDFESRLGVRRAYVTWVRAIGIRTGFVDTGEGGGSLHYKEAPVVVWHFKPRREHVEEARRLVERSCIEEGLRESILKRLVL